MGASRIVNRVYVRTLADSEPKHVDEMTSREHWYGIGERDRRALASVATDPEVLKILADIGSDGTRIALASNPWIDGHWDVVHVLANSSPEVRHALAVQGWPLSDAYWLKLSRDRVERVRAAVAYSRECRTVAALEKIMWDGYEIEYIREAAEDRLWVLFREGLEVSPETESRMTVRAALV